MINLKSLFGYIYLYTIILILHAYIIVMNWFKYWVLGIKESIVYIKVSADTDSIVFLGVLLISLSFWDKNDLPKMTWDRKLFLITFVVWVNFMHFWYIMNLFLSSDNFILIYLGLGGLVILSSWIFIFQQILKGAHKIRLYLRG